MHNLLPQQYLDLIRQGKKFFLIDVRETWEHEEDNMGGICIPLSEVVSQAGVFAAHEMILVYCRKGIRSAIAIQKLEGKIGTKKLYNLEGGILAFRKISKKE